MTNYEKSNAVTEMDFEVSARAQRIAQTILVSTGYEARQKLSHFLINELAFNAGVERLKIRVKDEKQWHKKQNGRVAIKKYGVYYPRSKSITIQNLTAVRGQELAPKTFLDTLLHEWMHHYDFEHLSINSIHTKGFYSRISSLKEILNPWKAA